ncbi:hypothetical protein JW992_08190, partial [candidate division KSB1 bacterium]|nr:hypothetical protein [candidate division KSB1 bacterium]
MKQIERFRLIGVVLLLSLHLTVRSEDWQSRLPQPILSGDRGWVELYDEAWRLVDVNRLEIASGWAIADGRKDSALTSW